MVLEDVCEVCEGGTPIVVLEDDRKVCEGATPLIVNEGATLVMLHEGGTPLLVREGATPTMTSEEETPIMVRVMVREGASPILVCDDAHEGCEVTPVNIREEVIREEDVHEEDVREVCKVVCEVREVPKKKTLTSRTRGSCGGCRHSNNLGKPLQVMLETLHWCQW